jgi:hypothetical protein
MNRAIVFLILGLQGFISISRALPQRLVIGLDGISWRDMKALQAGVTYTNGWGSVIYRQAFTTNEGYFPVSRLISTFPSTSDVAWTDIFGDRPLPGYQRTYFSDAANSEIAYNGLTTTVEHERQMHFQVQDNFVRSMGYLQSGATFNFELMQMVKGFLSADSSITNYYVYVRSSDDAQHMSQDILLLLCELDKQLQDLRASYRASQGRDLQIVILSDHGHNHAGRGERVEVKSFLEKAGYRIARSLNNPKDVVLPTSGIEDWIEVHNAPGDTEALAKTLTQLKGTDIVAARLQTNRFLVLNTRGERAIIQWNVAKNSFKYSAENGDPLNYLPVVAALNQKSELDVDGFATADDWMSETMTNHYPMAPERIARGLTRVTLNPATILVSLDNHYVNDGWLVNEGSRLVDCGSTHGALDDINSVGIVMSNFSPTHDTSTGRVAGLFDNFAGLRNYHAQENGAEWVVKSEQAMTRIPRLPFTRDYASLANNQVFLRVWSPLLTNLDDGVSIETTVEKLPTTTDQIVGVDPPERISHELHLTFNQPVAFPEKSPYERVYGFPLDLVLEPLTFYDFTGWVRVANKDVGLFEFTFSTDDQGKPAAY